MQSVRGVLALMGVTVISLLLIPVQWVSVKAGWSLQRHLPVLWHRMTKRLLGIRIEHKGAISKERPLLIVSNHSSWLDIVVLGSSQPLSFIAKSEVASWPIFGLFAKLQRTVFVNRSRRTDTGRVTKEVARRMAEGDAMVLFAEGTSNNGSEVKPFRSAILGAVQHAMLSADAGGAYVQPLSIAYTRLHGMPMGRFWRHHASWYGDMELPGHLWAIVKSGGLDVTLHWGEPIMLDEGVNRKALTRKLEEDVRERTTNILMGRA